MQVFDSLDSLQLIEKPVITIGTFDGVHIGHQKILSILTAKAAEIGGSSLLLTFWPHPRMVLGKEPGSLQLLNTIDEKKELLARTGLDYLVILPFTKAFSELSHEDFVKDILVGGLRAHTVIVGYDHHFGKNREGSFDELVRLAPKYGFEVAQIPVRQVDEVAVSSTKIRNALESGDVRLAHRFLGYSFMVSGTVVRGDQLGRKLGYPTANIQVQEEYKLIPANGVYAVRVFVNENQYSGMMNIGFRPTVNGKDKRLEVNIFDFDEDIYGQRISILFIEHIRKEGKFVNIDALREQLALDGQAARKALFANDLKNTG